MLFVFIYGELHRPSFVSCFNEEMYFVMSLNLELNKIENPGLVQQEQIKYRKHADFYAPVGFAFFAFVVSCFRSFGSTAVHSLFSLADLETRQHEFLLALQGLSPMDLSTCSQFCRQSSDRLGHVVAKNSVVRLFLGVLRISLPQPVGPIPSSFLPQNCPGLADSFSPPILLTYASLGSLPPFVLLFLCPFSMMSRCSFLTSFERYWPLLSFCNETPLSLTTEILNFSFPLSGTGLCSLLVMTRTVFDCFGNEAIKIQWRRTALRYVLK
jgi:hypothetical protein